MDSTDDAWITKAEAAEMLHCSTRTVDRLVLAGHITKHRQRTVKSRSGWVTWILRSSVEQELDRQYPPIAPPRDVYYASLGRRG